MCDCDAPTVCNATLRTARKQHQCCECKTDIEPGDTYEYTSGVWEHTGQSFKSCMVCAEFRQVIEDNLPPHYCYPAFGCLYDDVYDEDF